MNLQGTEFIFVKKSNLILLKIVSSYHDMRSYGDRKLLTLTYASKIGIFQPFRHHSHFFFQRIYIFHLFCVFPLYYFYGLFIPRVGNNYPSQNTFIFHCPKKGEFFRLFFFFFGSTLFS